MITIQTAPDGVAARVAPALGDLPTAPAKLRILTTADELFYDEGIRSVGVDRLIAESRVTKATFYKHYGSKNRLIAAYIGYRHRRVAERIAAAIGESRDAEAALRAELAALVADIESPRFRGCPFINAAAEFSDPAHPVRQAVREHREWYAATLERLLRDLGHPLPGDAADDLVLARDGAMSGGYAGDPIAAVSALARAFERVIAVADAGRAR